MASRKPPPRHSVLIAARLITAVVSIAGAEGVLWFAGYPAWRDQQLATSGGEFAPDSELAWLNREGKFTLGGPLRPDPFVYTNWSGGRRATAERESPADAANRPEVLFFGDSYVQGYGLSDWETLPWMVQKRHPEIRVTNFGTSYYGTYQSYLSMKRSVRGASAVYYLFNWFHEGRNAGEAGWIRVAKPPPPGFFLPYAVLAGDGIESRRSPGVMVWPLSRVSRTVAMMEEYYELAGAYPRVRNKRRLTEELLVRMNELVRGAGGRFTVILFDLDPDVRQDYRRFLESRSIAFVDCDRPEMRDPRLRLPDGHPNQKLNELLAGWLEPVPSVPAQIVSQTTP